MKNIKGLYLILISAILFVACDGEDPLLLSSQYAYEQTHCSDPWGNTNEAAELDSLVSDYLAAKEIEVLASQVEGGEIASCRACTCVTGRSIVINLSDQDGQKLLDLNEGWKSR
ncbi:MAG: hypothetical protein R8P61_19130 [Bacteroidia bacterium]|nr:hypothetical protein [Bacteroidia bacterium]